MVDKDVELFAVVDPWYEFAEYIALEIRALFVKREMTALAAVVAVASAVIRHGSLPSYCIVGKTLTCISCIVRTLGIRLPTLSLLAIPSTGGIGARVALLG